MILLHTQASVVIYHYFFSCIFFHLSGYFIYFIGFLKKPMLDLFSLDLLFFDSFISIFISSNINHYI